MPKLYKFLHSTKIYMCATPTVQNRVSPHIGSSLYVSTNYPLSYKVILLAAIWILKKTPLAKLIL